VRCRQISRLQIFPKLLKVLFGLLKGVLRVLRFEIEFVANGNATYCHCESPGSGLIPTSIPISAADPKTLTATYNRS
jgi:hypothetical protein